MQSKCTVRSAHTHTISPSHRCALPSNSTYHGRQRLSAKHSSGSPNTHGSLDMPIAITLAALHTIVQLPEGCMVQGTSRVVCFCSCLFMYGCVSELWDAVMIGWECLQLFDGLPWNACADIHGAQRMDPSLWWSPDFSFSTTTRLTFVVLSEMSHETIDAITFSTHIQYVPPQDELY